MAGDAEECGLYKDIFIQPAAGDAGGAFGAALSAFHMEAARFKERRIPNLFSAYLGPEYGGSGVDGEVILRISRRWPRSSHLPKELLFEQVARLIRGKGNVVGCFEEGRMEWGPRAFQDIEASSPTRRMRRCGES
jgi:carbamoyltransferase